MKSLKEIREIAKSKGKDVGTTFKVRIPNPDKQFAKDNGASWNADLESFVVKCEDIEIHPLREFSVDSNNWIRVVGKVPYEYRKALKEHGLVSEVQDGVWSNWILLAARYQELAETLVDLDLLDLDGKNE